VKGFKVRLRQNSFGKTLGPGLAGSAYGIDSLASLELRTILLVSLFLFAFPPWLSFNSQFP